MLELLRGNPNVSETYQFNLLYFPNSSGHWLLALFLLFTSAFTATKLMVSLTYLSFVASVGWLRWRTAGSDGVVISILIGAALGFNWMWLQGFYNFIFGMAVAIFTIGLYFGWQDGMNWKRSLILAVLVLLTFWSHIVSLPVVAGSVAVIAICRSFPVSGRNVRNLLLSAVSFVPLIPFVIGYRAYTEAGGPMQPIWRSVQNAFSLTDWFTQIRSADSFILISRKTFPFLDIQSEWLAVFTPLLWIGVALIILSAATFLVRCEELKGKMGQLAPFFLLSGLCLVIAIFSPDDLQFSDSKGGVIRERVLLSGLVLIIPILRFRTVSRAFRIGAMACLVFVILFQTAAMWEFAVRSDRQAAEFFKATSAIPEGASVAAITITPGTPRFSASSISSMNNFNGTVKNIRVWDNYEFGHYLFPVVPVRPEDRLFTHNLTSNNTYFLDRTNDFDQSRLDKLRWVFENNDSRINTLIVWGSDPRIETIIEPWIETAPLFSSDSLRVFRIKATGSADQGL